MPQTGRQRAAGEAGSLLTEAALATAVFLVGLLAPLGAIRYAVGEWADSSRRATATALARSWLEELRGKPWDDPDLSLTAVGVPRQIQVTLGGVPYQLAYYVTHERCTDCVNPWKNISVRVTYPRPGAGGSGQVDMVTFRGKNT